MIPSSQDIKRYVQTNKELLTALEVDDKFVDSIETSALGQGEHNINYQIEAQSNGQTRLFVLRINVESQMKLERQIAYEYASLLTLMPSGRTPKPLYLDVHAGCAGNDVLVEEFIEGRWMDFSKPTDIEEALCILADIHALKLPEETGLSRLSDLPEETHLSRLSGRSCLSHTASTNLPCLIKPTNPLLAQLEEDKHLIDEYRASSFCSADMLKHLEQMYHQCVKQVENSGRTTINANHLLNTEAVPSHFLINEKGIGHMVDWEKPIIGEAAQDLAYFLSPTTTIWDTDFIFSSDQRQQAIDTYCEKVNARFAIEPVLSRLRAYTATNCLRGLAWSARAWTQYQSETASLINEKTAQKLQTYLDEDFFALCWDLVLDNY